MHQITYLCQELAGISESSDVPDQVFTLMKLVKTDVTKNEISTLLDKATKYKEELFDEAEDNFEGNLPRKLDAVML